MLRNILLTILMITSLYMYGQTEEEFRSSELENYYKKAHKNYKPFKPITEKKILKYSSTGFEISTIENYNPFTDTLFSLPSQRELVVMPPPPKNEKEFIGGIDKRLVLKFEKKEDVHVFIYTNYELQNIHFGETGIWIAISNNGGKNWKHSYTDLVQKQPVFLKWYSKIPLISESNKIQIEAALLQQQTPFSHPGLGADYKLVKDGLKITFDIEALLKDTDNDGLTDILERKLHLNPQKKDTDNDGIDDYYDLNPRYDRQKTELSSIYETVLNEVIPWDSVGLTIKGHNEEISKYEKDSTYIVQIVTDVEELLHIQPKKHKVIFLTTKEYKKSKTVFSTELNEISITPLFKVDGYNDKYIISISEGTGSETYLVEKIGSDWGIKLISACIS